MVSAETARRRDILRLAAPVAALALATGAVLLARAALHGGEDDASPATATRPAAAQAIARPRSAPPPPARRTTPAAASYVVRSGDTLAAIAERRRTTVERLLELNPGIDPAALVVGRSIRVPA